MSDTNTATAPETTESAPKASEKKGAQKKGAQEKKAKVKTDRFGSRVDSVQHKINSVLTKKPATAAAILKKAEVKNGYYHLKRLADAGKIVHTDEGYALPAKEKADGKAEPSVAAS